MNDAHTTCSPCQAGTGPNVNRTSCLPCVGSRFSTVGVCQLCSAGSVASTDKIRCDDISQSDLRDVLTVADANVSLLITGQGDVLEPENNLIGIGSGGNYALSAARALIDTDLTAEEVARKSIKIASDICVYTNNNITLEKIDI